MAHLERTFIANQFYHLSFVLCAIRSCVEPVQILSGLPNSSLRQDQLSTFSNPKRIRLLVKPNKRNSPTFSELFGIVGRGQLLVILILMNSHVACLSFVSIACSATLKSYLFYKELFSWEFKRDFFLS